MTREVVLDTETTGIDPTGGDRLVEIGCLELINHLPTDNTYQAYINPKRPMPAGAFAVHGLSEAFLGGHPEFDSVCDGFLDFIADSPLVIHNAEFDLGFINAELTRINRPSLDPARAINTLDIARRKFPGSPASLDALCRRFGIDTSDRSKHGALIDVELLAQVYLELIGGRQPGLGLGAAKKSAIAVGRTAERAPRASRPHEPSADEIALHGELVDSLNNAIWRR
jgi:DNA polymerase-3 subunit epsilon